MLVTMHDAVNAVANDDKNWVGQWVGWLVCWQHHTTTKADVLRMSVLMVVGGVEVWTTAWIGAEEIRFYSIAEAMIYSSQVQKAR